MEGNTLPRRTARQLRDEQWWVSSEDGVIGGYPPRIHGCRKSPHAGGPERAMAGDIRARRLCGAGRLRDPLQASILYLSRLFESAYRSGNANATLRYKVPACKSFVSGKS